MLNNAELTPFVFTGAAVGLINSDLTCGVTFVVIILIAGLGSDVSIGPISGDALIFGAIFGVTSGYTSKNAIIVGLISGVSSGVPYGGAYVCIIGFVFDVTSGVASGADSGATSGLGFVVIIFIFGSLLDSQQTSD